jgi:hypothetical protein
MDWDVTFWSPTITWCGHIMFNFRQRTMPLTVYTFHHPSSNTCYVWWFYNNWCKGQHYYQFCLDFCDDYRMWIFFIHCLHRRICSFMKYICKSPDNLLAYFIPCGWILWDLYVFDTGSGRRVWLSINSSQPEVFCLLFNHTLCDEKLFNVVQYQFPVSTLIQREETSTQCLQVLVRDRERIQSEYKIRNWGNFIKEESTPSRGSVCFWREIVTSQDLIGKIYINLQDDIKGADNHVSLLP